MSPARARRGQAGWGALGLVALALAWQAGHWAFGPFVLPSLAETGRALAGLIASGAAVPALAQTAVHALGGFLAGGAAGLALGLLGGAFVPVGAAVRPALTAILGTPPIAWVVLALLWFGPGGGAPTFTVAVTAAPIVFLAALQGVRAGDPRLAEMAAVYRAPPLQRLTDLLLPRLAQFLAPAFATALAFAFKVAVMAEVLSGADGVGGAIATARAYLDLPQTMAWIVLVVAALLAADAVLFAPLRGWIAANGPAPAAAG
ncbi:ABC transporter permease [Xanthobacter tagetidis]|uniref:ABC transporter permease subunit n=1 Tax=Xanthobacter tagetidis TaxID=60216 RepID=A0A3L7AL62_9HYPH|nr:ABC transporter permease subunit [Xanthobacter tagetidis]MBB6307602.1 NitT/TauT family transport system permease protein [Xanthobacter tagetidis]RLP81169.1 ABC transporter permease subunit [Xanthobacter tagetidis]